MGSEGNIQYDLHSHTTASDGELSPAELVAYAARSGVDVLAVTDHDSTDAVAEAQQAAKQHEISVLSGVEISVTWNSVLIHIVGLNFNIHHAPLQQGLAGIRDQRDDRARAIADKLAECGIPGAFEGAAAFSNGDIISRTHFAKFMLKAGHVSSMQEAFDKYIGNRKKAYVDWQWATLEDALNWIHDAGGQAVIAHPARYGLKAKQMRALIDDFKQLGGKGFEVVSGSHDVNATHNMADYARRYELHASAGSDYHGPSQTWRTMGKLPPLPKGLTPIWDLWSDQEFVQ